MYNIPEEFPFAKFSSTQFSRNRTTVLNVQDGEKQKNARTFHQLESFRSHESLRTARDNFAKILLNTQDGEKCVTGFFLSISVSLLFERSGRRLQKFANSKSTLRHTPYEISIVTLSRLLHKRKLAFRFVTRARDPWRICSASRGRARWNGKSFACEPCRGNITGETRESVESLV